MFVYMYTPVYICIMYIDIINYKDMRTCALKALSNLPCLVYILSDKGFRNSDLKTARFGFA